MPVMGEWGIFTRNGVRARNGGGGGGYNGSNGKFFKSLYIIGRKVLTPCCKRVFEAAKIAYADKTKESITSFKLALVTW